MLYRCLTFEIHFKIYKPKKWQAYQHHDITVLSDGESSYPRYVCEGLGRVAGANKTGTRVLR